MEGKFRLKINNAPNKLNRFVVARVVDGELWFYGSFDIADRAEEARNEIDGLILETSGQLPHLACRGNNL